MMGRRVVIRRLYESDVGACVIALSRLLSGGNGGQLVRGRAADAPSLTEPPIGQFQSNDNPITTSATAGRANSE